VNQSVVVVGAGVLGCNLADELTRRGATVTVIDSAEAGSGTSAATFAWVNSNNKTPAEYGLLNKLGLQAHERRARRTAGAGRWFHQIGALEIAQSDQEMAALEAKVDELKSHDYDSKVVTAETVRGLEHALDAHRVVGGALFEQEGWIDVQTMCLTLLERAVEAGAVFAPYETVTDIAPTEVTTTAADGSTRRHRADVVILAAGNGNRRILAAGGIGFPTIDPEGHDLSGDPTRATVGIISTTGPIDSGVRHILHADGISLRPARNGGITFADSPTGGKWEFSDPQIWTVPALLLDRARELYPCLRNVSTETVSLGTRVLPEDGMTIADWINDDHSVYAVATHSGLTLSAHLGAVVADEVLTGTRDESLRSFGLSRFATA